ncbi:hypothetical protein C1645_816992 [Glomus cerebriforme]|uniref:Uncharacterized protein n=1 Tax=Glomus cerebriforme TaxID=658196 RepID=A0A397TAJ2_9GLOM|nr:hypothetical protein C1645_816992 [Glomus cerebriforme]
MPATRRLGQAVPIRSSKWWLTRVVRLRHEYVLRESSSWSWRDCLRDRRDRQGSSPSIA